MLDSKPLLAYRVGLAFLFLESKDLKTDWLKFHAEYIYKVHRPDILLIGIL